MKLVSVIMSVYNGEKYLKTSIESILKQSYGNFEFIIINDCSSDNTSNILAKASRLDNRIRIVSNETNLGLTRSLNKALVLARGEYIARQDADDISGTERFARQIERMEDSPELMLLGTGGYLVDENGRRLWTEKIHSGSQKLKKIIRKRNCFIHGSVMIRKKCLEKTGLYREEFRYGQDYDLFLRFSESFVIDNLTEPLYSYRLNEKGISALKSKEQLWNGMIIREAAIRRRKDREREFWSRQTYGEIEKSLDNAVNRRKLMAEVHLSTARNFLLFGRKNEALREFGKAFLNNPCIKNFYYLIRTVSCR